MSLFTSETKPTSNWYVAATHYLTGGLVAPGMISAIIAYGLNSFINTRDLNIIFNTLLGSIIGILSLGLGIIYSQNYIKRHYIIKDINQVIKTSTIFYFIGSIIILILFYAFGILYLIAIGLGHHECDVTQFCDPKNLIISYSILTIIETYLFHILSKKYLNNTSPNII